MRAIFLILILANAAFFYWQSQWKAGPETLTSVAPMPAKPGVKTLTLLSELPPEPKAGITPIPPLTEGKPAAAGDAASATEEPMAQDSSAVQTGQQQPPSTPPVCYTFGPLTDAAMVTRLVQAMAVSGITPKQRDEVKKELRGYWVYLPPYKSYDAASQEVKRLKAKGIKDLFIMGRGESKNAISLGLFKTQAAAEKRLKRVRDLGFKALLDEQYRETTLQWLDFSIPEGDEALAAAVDSLAKKYPDAQLKQHDCE